MKDLYDMGFDERQINQILKIQELGWNCAKYISTDISVEKLRILKTLLFKDNYTNAQKRSICNYLVEKDFDITKYYDIGIKEISKINLIYQIEVDNLNVTPFLDSSLTYDDLALMNKYLREYNINIKDYIKDGYSKNEISLAIELNQNGYNYKDLRKDYNVSQINAICSAIKKGIDILSYINPDYNTKQIDGITYALSQKIDMTKVLNKGYSGSVIKVITDGLVDNIDITSFMDKDSSKEYAEAILKALKNNLDASVYKDIEDIRKYKTVYLFLSNNIDVSKINFNDYTIEQLKFIFETYKMSQTNKKININRIINNNYSIYKMQIIVEVMCEGKEPSIYENEKLSDRQIKAIYNAKDVELSELIDENTTPITIEAIVQCIKSGYNITKKEL